VEAMVDSLAREIVQRVIRDATERAGKPLALANELPKLGFEPRGRRTVSGWRTGDSFPTAEVLIGIALRYNLSIDRYLSGTELPTDASKTIHELQQEVGLLKSAITEMCAALAIENPLDRGVIAAAVERGGRKGA
jgi:transcriptional regulator with XRE-family HTH domain